MSPNGTYQARLGDPALDRDLVLSVWRGNLGREDRHPIKYSWFYEQCPFGTPLLAFLNCEGGPAIGVAAAGVRPMLYMGRHLRAGVLVDMAVVPAHRTLLPALMLQKFVIRVASPGFGLLYGFPNPKAAAVFSRAGYQKFGELVRLVCVVRSASVLAGKLPALPAKLLGTLADLALGVANMLRARRRVRVEWQDEPWPFIDAIWAESQKPGGPIAVRNAAFVRWRLVAASDVGVRFLVARDRSSSQPVAWAACEIRGDIMFVTDYWGLDGVGQWVASTLRQLAWLARKANCRQLSLEYMGSPQGFKHLRRAGFVRRNSRPVYGRFLQDDPEKDKYEWHLTAADEDE